MQQQIIQQKKKVVDIITSGAIGLSIVGALIGAAAGAGAISGLAALGGNFAGAATTLVTEVPFVGDAIVEAIVGAKGTLAAGTGAIAGLLGGGVAGAALGVPIGAVAAPLYEKQKATEEKQKQIEAAIPVVAQKAWEQGHEVGEEHGRDAAKQMEQESSKFRDIVATQRQSQSQEAGVNI